MLILVEFVNHNDFYNWQSRRIRLPEDDVGALKHVGVLTIYKILLILGICWPG
jgi:hypothetical protein